MEDSPAYLIGTDVQKQIADFEIEFNAPFAYWNRQQWLKVALILSGMESRSNEKQDIAD